MKRIKNIDRIFNNFNNINIVYIILCINNIHKNNYLIMLNMIILNISIYSISCYIYIINNKINKLLVYSKMKLNNLVVIILIIYNN